MMNQEETMNGPGLFFVLEDCGEVGGFSPLYAAETEQSSAEAGTSKRNMEFIRRTMLSAKVQDVVDQQAAIGSGSGRRRGILLGRAPP
jgi:hypothetical protein